MIALQISDSDLVAKCVKGCDMSLNLIVERHKDNLYRFIYSKTKDKFLTEDILQDSFIKIIHNIKYDKYKEQGRFLSWAMKVSNNLLMDHYRKNKTKLVYDYTNYSITANVKDSSLDIESYLIKTQDEKDLIINIEKLPEEQKEVVYMRYYREMSFKEISKTTNISINTVLGRMRYAIINLRKTTITC
ncbi:MAG: RNA polymerase sigma factor [Flavobacteriaceae bacterium]|nr:RNA polymerase sigma factor [Flavobacteriaceae bacterium]